MNPKIKESIRLYFEPVTSLLAYLNFKKHSSAQNIKTTLTLLAVLIVGSFLLKNAATAYLESNTVEVPAVVIGKQMNSFSNYIEFEVSYNLIADKDHTVDQSRPIKKSYFQHEWNNIKVGDVTTIELKVGYARSSFFSVLSFIVTILGVVLAFIFAMHRLWKQLGN